MPLIKAEEVCLWDVIEIDSPGICGVSVQVVDVLNVDKERFLLACDHLEDHVRDGAAQPYGVFLLEWNDEVRLMDWKRAPSRPRFVPIAEAALRAGVSVDTMQEWIKTGLIRAECTPDRQQFGVEAASLRRHLLTEIHRLLVAMP